jgi:uncharacterized coiled-coil protein SlyX
MQASSSSKPLALVIIGLILGASLGLGSGYAIFYPQMVRESNQSIEDRIMEVEDSLAKMDAQLAHLNQSLGAIQDNLDPIIMLSDAMSGMGTRIAAMEINLSQVQGRLTGLEQGMATVDEDWARMMADFTQVKTIFQDVNTQLSSAQDRLSQVVALDRLYAYVANPGQINVVTLTAQIHTALVAKNVAYDTWVKAFGETTAKNLLTPVVDGKMGRMVWNKASVSKVATGIYQVRLEAYTGLEFTAASVTVNKMRLEARANVNTVTGEITQFSFTAVEIL